jgi:hypothetical protein
MTKPNFTTMTILELRAYVLEHRNDQDAFYALSDRIHEEGVLVESDQHFRQLIQAKIDAKKKSE